MLCYDMQNKIHCEPISRQIANINNVQETGVFIINNLAKLTFASAMPG